MQWVRGPGRYWTEGVILINGSYGIVWDWSPKGYVVSNRSHKNRSYSPHKRLHWQMHKVFDHTNITTHSDHPITWHASGMPSPFPQPDKGRGPGEIWRLALSLKKFQIWDGHYSDKTHYLLIFNTSTNWTFYIQSCVRDSYVLSKGTVSINGSVQELSCQDCKLYTCLNSSLYNSNHSFVTLRRRLGIWLPVNQTRPWEGSPETHALLKVIKKVLQRFKSLLDSL